MKRHLCNINKEYFQIIFLNFSYYLEIILFHKLRNLMTRKNIITEIDRDLIIQK